MGKMKDILYDIDEMLSREEYSYVEIAETLGVPIEWVWEVADEQSNYVE